MDAHGPGRPARTAPTNPTLATPPGGRSDRPESGGDRVRDHRGSVRPGPVPRRRRAPAPSAPRRRARYRPRRPPRRDRDPALRTTRSATPPPACSTQTGCGTTPIGWPTPPARSSTAATSRSCSVATARSCSATCSHSGAAAGTDCCSSTGTPTSTNPRPSPTVKRRRWTWRWPPVAVRASSPTSRGGDRWSETRTSSRSAVETREEAERAGSQRIEDTAIAVIDLQTLRQRGPELATQDGARAPRPARAGRVLDPPRLRCPRRRRHASRRLPATRRVELGRAGHGAPSGHRDRTASSVSRSPSSTRRSTPTARSPRALVSCLVGALKGPPPTAS